MQVKNYGFTEFVFLTIYGMVFYVDSFLSDEFSWQESKPTNYICFHWDQQQAYKLSPLYILCWNQLFFIIIFFIFGFKEEKSEEEEEEEEEFEIWENSFCEWPGIKLLFSPAIDN